MSEIAFRWSGIMLVVGAALLGIAIILVSLKPVINEVFPNPSGDSSEATEFIELYNTDGSQGAALGAGLGAGIYHSAR